MLDELKTLSVPDRDSLDRSAAGSLRMAESIVINDDADYEMAAEELTAVKAKAKALEERRMSITKPLDQAKKAVMDLFRGPAEALTQAELVIKRAMISYQDEVKRKAEEERRRAEELAAQERARLEAEAARAKEEAAKAETPEQAAELLAQAEQATAVATVLQAPTVADSAPKVKGVSTRVTLDYEVRDMLAFVRWIAVDRPDLVSLLLVDSVRMRAIVRAVGDSSPMPGIEIVEKKSLSSRAA